MKSPSTHNNARLKAFEALKAVMIEGQSLTQALSVFPDIPAYAKAICFGTLRDYQRLSVIINQLVDKKPKKKALEILLLMGIFQLQSTDKPDYACVTETVSLTRVNNLGWASGMVNGVLRRFIRDKANILLQCEQDERYRYNHPVWLIDKLRQAWPDHYQQLLKANDHQAPMTIRVNSAKTTPLTYSQQLEAVGVFSRLSQHVPTAITLSTPMAVEEMPGFSQGLLSVQDEAAQLAGPLLRLSPGQRVLDACAAPGGKTCHMLELEPTLAEVVAIDVSEKRLEKIRENLKRLNLQASLLCADAGDVDAWWDGKPFDRILLDAPCSALGVVRRHPDIKYHRKPEDITQLIETQKRLLNALWPLLKPGGLLLYATCSILPEENDQQMEAFCEQWGDANVEPIQLNLPSASKLGLQLFPTPNGYDGFYYALLRKS
ncbi:16S rRNA (cytosine(967)-C(5))-methyltransferase RsmB [Legionella sp. W05-934-2]|uniref:16S rRNA (cytosine(967)-C(5))-methyltransferase RsmB n=1 Tax=Legionella sp. W05-934-2 TaxID=1198649 RepID=UPI0034627E35